MAQILSTAEPFLLPGDPSKPGCLLIHGFTGTPKEMRWLGEHLQAQGFTCLGVRLTGHATNPDDMIRSRYADWIASVEDGYHLLSGMTSSIFLVGLSMGGMLSLLMSTRLKVKGVVAMSTPDRLPRDFPVLFMKVFSTVVKFEPKKKSKPGSGWFDKAGYNDHVAYGKNPVRSAAELKLLTDELRASLPKVTVPVLLIHSKDDKYVLPENSERIHAGLVNASEKTLLFVTESSHVVTKDAARHQVFEAASEFIRRVGGAG